ncbi:hypothetical protein PRUB_a4084 [Pseudoalteromonas rubra]|uniref:Uncharacterized protein n=1 Tax=Pseudoalteromonas rubra TaxID=43658 RepID=A0A8T0C8V8_9GAMM|nr:hypothetical protein [Pseudoalteromonas rubra]KAF7787204.1 hypothetical protein PRUB_a4084 [Pseudoalteromonas rubra]
MTNNLFSGNTEPSGYLSYSGNSVTFVELANVATSLPILVEPGKIYRVTPDGGTASRFRLRENLEGGASRANASVADGNWTEHFYVAGADVVTVEIYYKNTTDTATGLVFVEAEAKPIEATGFVGSIGAPNLIPAFAARLELDLDKKAERVILFDRQSGEMLDHFFVKPMSSASVDGYLVNVTLPVKYSLGPSVTCVLFDDNLDYSGAVMDGIQCDVTDLSS